MIDWALMILRKIAEPVLVQIGGTQLDRLRRWRAQQAIRESSGRKIAILLTKIAGDTPTETLRQTLNDAIRHELGHAVEITRLTEPLPYGDGHESDAELAAHETAQQWLADKNADLLIAGRDKGRNARGETVLALQLIAADADDREPQPYKLTDTLDLPVNFIADLGAVIAARLTEKFILPEDVSDASLAALRIAADRLQPIVEKLSPAFDADTRGSLLFTYALARDRIGELANTTEDIAIAAETYRAALEEWPRERAPADWARVQNNLGNVLRTLSEREDSTPRLAQAIAAFRATLEVATREADPLTWAGANLNLGVALRTLGARTGGTASLPEAIAAYRNAIAGLAPWNVAWLAPGLQAAVGDMLLTLGESADDPARLEEAVAAYREALKEQTRESNPDTWPKIQHELGLALGLLGERESGTARLEEAIAAFRAALSALDPGKASESIDICRANLARAEAALAERRKPVSH